MSRMRSAADVGAGEGEPHTGVTMTRAIAVSTVGVLPAFLAGSLSVQIREELGFGPAALGLAVAAFFATTALGSVTLGRIVEQIGWARSMRLAVALSVASLAGVAAAGSWVQLVGFLVLGGLGNAVSQPAANLSLTRAVPDDRQGLAFGVKQSAIPTSTLLGGLAVPAIALSVGWRWAFVAAIAAAVAATALLLGRAGDGPVRRRRRQPGEPTLRAGDVSAPPLVVLAVGSGLAAAAATSLGAFLVASAVDAGLRPGTAGLVFALASAVGLTVRIVLGWLADLAPQYSRIGFIAGQLGVGALGYLLLASASRNLFVVGTLLAFGAGWGWPGLFHFAVVTLNPHAPAAATGIVQTGLSLGAGLGPLLFGLIVEHASYAVAWTVDAALAAVGAGALLAGRRWIRVDVARRGVSTPRTRARAARAARRQP